MNNKCIGNVNIRFNNVFTDGIHVTANNKANLHEFAESIGLKEESYVNDYYYPHYILNDNVKRNIVYGDAIGVTSNNLIKIYQSYYPCKSLAELGYAYTDIGVSIESENWMDLFLKSFDFIKL